MGKTSGKEKAGTPSRGAGGKRVKSPKPPPRLMPTPKMKNQSTPGRGGRPYEGKPGAGAHDISGSAGKAVRFSAAISTQKSYNPNMPVGLPSGPSPSPNPAPARRASPNSSSPHTPSFFSSSSSNNATRSPLTPLEANSTWASAASPFTSTASPSGAGAGAEGWSAWLPTWVSKASPSHTLDYSHSHPLSNSPSSSKINSDSPIITSSSTSHPSSVAKASPTTGKPTSGKLSTGKSPSGKSIKAINTDLPVVKARKSSTSGVPSEASKAGLFSAWSGLVTGAYGFITGGSKK